MNLLLINPPRREDSYLFPPMSLLYISQAARAAGHKSEIMDIPYLLEKHSDKFSMLDDSIIDYIRNHDCDVIGLGGVVSTYFYFEYLVNKLREIKPGVPIVIGGSVGVPIKDVWEKHAPADYLVDSDGEHVIQMMLDAMDKGDNEAIKNIPGVYYLENGKYVGKDVELLGEIDDIGFLDYEELDFEYYIDGLTRWIEDIIPDRSLLKAEKLRFLPILTTRGCPYKCTFCFHFNRRHRYHSNEYVINNIKFLKEKYNINGLYIVDDLFIMKRNHTIELCNAIGDADLGVYFMGSGGKPNLMVPEMLQAMKRAGFIRFSYGIETGSQKMLTLMEKKANVQQNYDALKMAEDAGVPCFANMIFGMPGEDRETLRETKEFLINADLNTKHFYGSWATAYPGTPLYDWMIEKGMVSDTRRYLYEVGSIGKYLVNFTDLPIIQLKKLVYYLHQEVDMAYHWKHKEYLPFCEKLFMKFLGIVYYNLPDLIRNRLKGLAKKILTRKQKRDEKPSNIEIEKWALERIRLSEQEPKQKAPELQLVEA